MSQSNDSASKNESKWKFQLRKPPTVAFSQYESGDEPGWRCWPGVAPELNNPLKLTWTCSFLRL